MTFLQAVQKQYNRLRGKALTGHPELSGRVHILSGAGKGEGFTLQDYADFAGVYGAHVWAHKAVSKTAQTAGRLSVGVVDEAGPLPQHDLSKLLGYINESSGPGDFWQACFINMLIAGEFAAEIVDNGRGVPVELWERRPDKLNVLPDTANPLFPRVAGYTWGDNPTVLEPTRLWHCKFYNPLNQWRGLAPIAAVREGLTIDIFAQAWAKTFLKQGARPDYAVIAPQGITKTERETLEAEFMAKFGGVDNWHKPLVLEEGITDIKTFSFPPKDIEWLQQREMARDEVAAIFGMPDEIMGFGRDTYENFDTAWRVWWLLTLKPLCDNRDNSLTWYFSHVRPMLKPGQRIQTDMSEIGAIQDDLTGQIDNAIKFVNIGIPFQVVNERFRLGFAEGVEPVKATPPVSQPEPPIADAPPVALHAHSHTKAIAPAFDDWRKVAQNALAKGWGQRPFFDDDIPVSQSYRLAIVLGLCDSKAAIDHVFNHVDEYTKAELGPVDEVPDSRLKLEGVFVEALGVWLGEQVARISDRVKLSKLPPDNDFWDNEKALLVAFSVPFVADWMESAIAESAGTLGGVGLGLDININARAAEWAGQHAAELAKGLTATTKEVVRAKIKNWATSGQPLQSLTDDLARIVSSKWRAELIASTEVTRAYAQAAQQIAREYPKVIKGLTWNTARDERVCPMCGPLHGVTIEVGGVFPGGYSEPPLHPRCRCWLNFTV